MTYELLVDADRLNVAWHNEDTIVAICMSVRETEELDVRSTPAASPPSAVFCLLSSLSRTLNSGQSRRPIHTRMRLLLSLADQ